MNNSKHLKDQKLKTLMVTNGILMVATNYTNFTNSAGLLTFHE